MIAHYTIHPVIEYDNPYPLGVPERVIRQMGQDSDFFEIKPLDCAFTIDCTRLLTSDRARMEDLVMPHLYRTHCDPETAGMIMAHIDREMRDKRVVALAIDYNFALGWHVKRAVRK